MQIFMGSLIAVVFIVLAGNVFMVLRRFRKDGSARSRKPAIDEQKAAPIRDRLIHSRLEQEKEEAERFIERRKKTFALYEYVRRKTAAAGQGAAAFDGSPEIDIAAMGYRKSLGLPFDENHKPDTKIDKSLFIPFDD